MLKDDEWYLSLNIKREMFTSINKSVVLPKQGSAPPFAIFGLLCQFGFLASHLTCLPCEQVALRNVVATSVSAVNKNWSHRNQCVITQVGM